jgi:hypothetical protein
MATVSPHAAESHEAFAQSSPSRAPLPSSGESASFSSVSLASDAQPFGAAHRSLPPSRRRSEKIVRTVIHFTLSWAYRRYLMATAVIENRGEECLQLRIVALYQ